MAVKKVLIVDDEEPARNRLLRLLSESKNDFDIRLAKNGIEAVEKIQTEKPDIVFLDIQMPGMTGFEVLQNIENRDFKVIFQTAFDEYALKAFEENACDYLLKPYETERFTSALNKALEQKSFEEKLSQLEQRFITDKKYLESLCIKTGNKMSIVKTSDIYSIASQDHYTCVYTEHEEHLCDLSLSHLEARLNPNTFFRCHRGHILNLKKVKSLKLGPLMEAKLDNDTSIPVSRQNRKEMKNYIN